MGLVVSVGGEVCVMNKPGCGKKMHSVFEGVFPVPVCISRPNRAKWSEGRLIPLIMLVLY